MKYPNPFRVGSKIAITAISFGIEPIYEARFHIARNYLESQGFEIVLGQCLNQWRFSKNPTQ